MSARRPSDPPLPAGEATGTEAAEPHYLGHRDRLRARRAARPCVDDLMEAAKYDERDRGVRHTYDEEAEEGVHAG